MRGVKGPKRPGPSRMIFWEIARMLGPVNTAKVCRKFGGMIVYIPLPESFEYDERNKEIVEEYKRGMAASKLSRKYHLTTSRVYKIIAAARNRKAKDVEFGLKGVVENED